MELRNCESCGRTFGSVDGQVLCTKCTMANIEDDFRLVRDYLYDHPGADVREVNIATGVEKPVILKLLKDGRIDVVDPENLVFKCEDCGKVIRGGRKCDDCRNNFAKSLLDTATELRASKGSGEEDRFTMDYRGRRGNR